MTTTNLTTTGLTTTNLTTTNLTATSQRPAPWFWRALSLFLLLSGALLTPVALGVVLTRDEEIHGRSALMMILAVRIVLSLTGAWLLIRPPRRLPFAAVRLLALTAAVSLAGFVLWANARQREWIRGRVRGVAEIRADFARGDIPTLLAGAIPLRQMQKSLAAAEAAGAEPARIVELRRAVADYMLREGQVEESLKMAQEGLRIAEEARLPEKAINPLRRAVGIAYMRAGQSALRPGAGPRPLHIPDPRRRSVVRRQAGAGRRRPVRGRLSLPTRRTSRPAGS